MMTEFNRRRRSGVNRGLVQLTASDRAERLQWRIDVAQRVGYERLANALRWELRLLQGTKSTTTTTD